MKKNLIKELRTENQKFEQYVVEQTKERIPLLKGVSRWAVFYLRLLFWFCFLFLFLFFIATIMSIPADYKKLLLTVFFIPVSLCLLGFIICLCIRILAS